MTELERNRLEGLIYVLVRDHLPFGVLEGLLENRMAKETLVSIYSEPT